MVGDGPDGVSGASSHAPSDALASATHDGPDRMGRELAEGPESVTATLAALDAAPGVARGLLDGARRTVIVGTGASLVMAQAAVPAWRAARRAQGDERPVLVREASAVAFGVDGEVLADGDVIVAISYRGSSPETVGAAEQARRAGRPVVAVTRPGATPLAGAAAAVVEVRCGEEEKGAATKSELATVAALLALGGALATGDAARSALEARLRGVVQDWASCAALGGDLARAAHTWAVGFGAGEGIAGAASLLWHEKVIRPAVGASVSTFRHGPVEAVRPGDAVVVIDVGPSGPSHVTYMGLLAREVRALGAVAVWIGPQPPEGVRGVPLADRGTGAILEATLRVQQLARAAALAAGTYAEDFRVLLDIVKAAPPIA